VLTAAHCLSTTSSRVTFRQSKTDRGLVSSGRCTARGAVRVAGRPGMMAVSRHRSTDTLFGYVRSADLFNEHAGAAFL
jgi:hypothetical protein